MNYWTQSEKNIYVAAHRGWCSKYPENTLEAFKAALEIGVDQLELDIRVTKDNELVVIHDALVDRTTDGTGLVKDMTLEELKKLDAGIKKGEEFKEVRIPTFIEFIELIKNHPTVTVDFELKEYPDEGWEDVSYSVCDRVFKIIDDYGYTERCVINTFSGKLHRYIIEKYGNKYKLHLYYPSKYMGKDSDDLYKHGYCVCMFKSGEEQVNMASKEEFDYMRDKYCIRPWAGACVMDEKTVDMAIERGAELITTNYPDVVLDILRKKGYHK